VIINPAATASAGGNQTVCAGSATAALGGTVGGGATGGTWSSSGTGSFVPNATVLNATYSPSAADIAAGTVTLTLSTTGQVSPCTPATAQVVVIINPAATASAGGNQTVCAGNATTGLGGTVGGGATGGTWSSSGTGTFAPNATALSATYSPSAADIAAGTVTLSLSSTGQQSPCGPATVQVVLSITQVTVTPPKLTGPMGLSNGRFQFAFSNNDPGVSFTVLTATNPSLPLSNWTVAGPATNTAPGLFQFSTDTTNNPQGFYRVRSP
jgi:hypothetical protein